MWYAYRYKFAYGTDTKWLFFEIYSKQLLKIKLEELASKYDYSEHYRGIDCKKIKLPNKEFLKAEIARIKDAKKALIEQLKRYNKLV